MKFQLWHVPVRLATGAFILNSGISKMKIQDEEAQKQIHGFASTAYPQFQDLPPKTFTRLLAAGEIALGAALLAPVVSPATAGAGLAAFSGGLLGLYFRVPGMREGNGIRPSQQGTAIAKDSWMLAIGLALMLDGASKKIRDAIPSRS